MGAIRLDARLSAVASLVKAGNTVADIGTDHAYLPAYLVQQGLSPAAIAADLRQQPLENAKSTIASCGLQSQIKTVLSDGLDALPEHGAQTVVLAGMGGILIAELLERTAWVFDSCVQIVAQPMSHPEDVRRFFFENGFCIDREVCARDAHHCYLAMAAHYTGKSTPFSPAMPYIGLLRTEQSPDAAAYLHRQYQRLKKRHDALLAAGGSEETAVLAAVLADFRAITTVGE